MIYAVVGNGNPKAIEKYRFLKEQFFRKYPNAQRLSFTEETLDAKEIFDAASQQSLFGGAYLVSCFRLSENAVIKEIFSDLIAVMWKSENHFLLFEHSLDKKSLALIEEHGKLYSFVPATTALEYNVFSLPQKVGERDRKGAWIELQRARMVGVSDDELLRPLLWQMKTILLVHPALGGASVEESGLKPTVYSRALSYGENYSREELNELSFALAMLPSRVVSGEVEMDIALESIILSI